MGIVFSAWARALGFAVVLGFLTHGGGALASPTPYVQQAEFSPAIGAVISGDTMAIGAPASNQTTIYARTAGVWTQQAVLTPSDPSVTGFGASLSISGDTIAISATTTQAGPHLNQGAVLVFTRTGGVWTQQAELQATDGTTQDFFGTVALDGDTLAVGASGWNNSQGKIYLFVRNAGAWSQQTEIIASDGMGQGFPQGNGDQLGARLSLSGDTLAAGAPLKMVGPNQDQGAGYIFVRSGVTWALQAELTTSQPDTGALFGSSVSVSGDTVVFGVQGSAYIFTRNSITGAWTRQTVLAGAASGGSSGFGGSVAISGDIAVVGSDTDAVNGNFLQGAAYVFARNGIAWTLQAKLLANDAAVDDCFGGRAALDGTTAVIGSICRNSGQGATYVFAPGAPPPPNSWVSATGSDANDCSQGSPCATFAAAFLKTAASGHINCLDPGDFGPLTITSSITIACQGATAGIQVFAGTGITVNVGPSDYVQLRGLSIDGEGPNGFSPVGIAMIGGGNLTIANCDIFGFQASATGYGLNLAGANGAHVLIQNAFIHDNLIGVRAAAASGSNSVTIDHSTLEGNLTANVSVGPGATAVLSASTIAGTPTALANTGGTIISYHNNFIRNAGTPSQTLPRQ